MIKARFDKSSNVFEVSFTGSCFQQVYSYVKINKYRWNPEEKVWICSPLKGVQFISDMEDVDIIDITDSDLESLILSANPKPDIKSTGIRFNSNCLKSDPLGDYQKQGISDSLRNNGFILNWDVGTGKTYTAISTENHLFQYDYSKKLIVLTVGSVLYNWKRELTMFGNFESNDIEIVESSNKEPFDPNKKVLVMTYNTYRIISEYWCKKIRKKVLVKPKESYLPIREWADNKCAIILDEVHKIKNPSAKQSKWVGVSQDQYVHKILATGTLTPKDFLDIWSPVNFLDPKIFNVTFSDFKSDICNLGTNFSEWGVDSFKEERIAYYKKLLEPYISYVNKRDVLVDKLANFNQRSIYMDMEDTQREIYQGVVQKALYRGSIKTPNGQFLISPKQIHNVFPYAIQALSDPLLILNSPIMFEGTPFFSKIKRWSFKKSTRLKYCTSIISDHLEDEPKSKFIIWCVNPDTIDRLGEYYAKYNPITIHGQSTPKGCEKYEYRDSMIRQFESDPKCKLLIANPPTIGTGQNIKGANISIFWSRSYSANEYIQAQGRNDRPNGPWKEIYEYVLMYEDTLDITLNEILNQRVDLNKLFANKESLDKDTLRKLFDGKSLI